jgi:hypothetical protein
MTRALFEAEQRVITTLSARTEWQSGLPSR